MEHGRKIRVAHVLSYVSSDLGGVPIATRKIGQLLKHYGVDVSFWTTGHGDDQKMLGAEGITGHVFPWTYLPTWRYAPGLRRDLNCHSDSIDILHVHEVWQYPQFMAIRTAKKNHLPFVWSPRACFEPWRMKYKGLKKSIYFSVLCHPFINKAACMHAVSEGEAEGIRILGYRGPIAVIPNGINVDEFASLPDPGTADLIWPALSKKRVVLFLSRLIPVKGIDELLPAWKLLVSKKSYDDAMLVLAGPDDRGSRRMIESEIDRLGIGKKVLMTGLVTGYKKMAIISRADLYVLPSYSEGFSNSLLENLAAGKPALITPGCHFPEAVAVGAALSVNPNRNELLDGLTNLLDLGTMALKEMGNRGRELIFQNYTWDISVRKYMTLYSAILDGGSIPMYPAPMLMSQPSKGVN